MKQYRFLAVALALAVCTAYFAIGVPVYAMAAMPGASHSGGYDLMGFITGHVPHMAFGLAALRADLDALTKRAADKFAELKDDTPADQARTIQADHEKILADIETKKREIAGEEERERAASQQNQNQQPGGTNRAEATRAADMLDIGTRAGMTNDVIQEAIRNGETLDAFRVRAFDHMVDRQNQTRTQPGRVLRDEQETRRTGIELAMARQMGGIDTFTPEQESRARSYMQNEDVVDFACEVMGHRGRVRSAMDRLDIIERAFHSTTDFPAIFGSAINTVLERQYALAQPSYRRISIQEDFLDFRPHYSVKIGEFPMLEKLTESGEIKFGTFGEGKEQVMLIPYASGVTVSRQMLINDRLNAIGRLLGGYGRTVSRFEERTFYTMMLSANTKLSDGKAVFHADHANLSGAGAAISVASLAEGKASMRKQIGLDGAVLDIQPSVLLVSPDKEVEALQYLAPILAADSLKVNPYVGTLDPVVSASLTGNAWYLFANPQEAPVYRWGLLDGATAPRIRMDNPFGMQGLRMSVELDFGCGAIDYRGAFKNAGN